MAITDLPQYTYADDGHAYYMGLLLSYDPNNGNAVVDVAGTPTVVTLSNPTIQTEDLRKGMLYCQRVDTGAQIITCFGYKQREFTLSSGTALGPNVNISDQQTQQDELNWWRHKDNPPVNETYEKLDTTTSLT